MKHFSLTIILITFFSFQFYSQETRVVKATDEENGIVNTNYNPSIKKAQLNRSKSANVEKIYLGYAQGFEFLSPVYNNLVDYNYDLNLITVTKYGTPTGGNDKGTIDLAYSTDDGLTWDTTLQIHASDVNPARNPAGVIFNPTGNTDVSKAYLSFMSVGVDANDNPVGTIVGNSNINGNNLNESLLTSPPQSIASFFLSVTQDSVLHSIGNNNTIKTAGTSLYTYYEGVLNKGIWNNTNKKFDFTQQSFFPQFKQNTRFNTKVGWPTNATVWSEDGSVGYVVFVGIDLETSDDMKFHNYLIYKTEDYGQNWVKQPQFDVNTLPECQNIPANAKGMLLSYIRGAIVDGNNDLHLLSTVRWQIGYRNDSADYLTLDPTEYASLLYDFYTKDDGTLGAIFIDTIFGKYKSETLNPLGFKWGNQINVAKNENGNILMYVWSDTDRNMGTEINLNPDIKGRAYDINSKELSNIYNFTVGTDYEANNYFLNISKKAYEPSGMQGVLRVPCITGLLPESSDKTIKLEYVSGIDFSFPVLSINESEKDIKNVSCYPNPASSNLTIAFYSENKTDIIVSLSNIMGQNVYEKQINSSKGTSNININTSDLNSGVYIYTLKSENTIKTGKVVVK